MSAVTALVDAPRPFIRRNRFRPFTYQDEDLRLQMACKSRGDEFRLTLGFRATCETQCARLLRPWLLFDEARALLRGSSGKLPCDKTVLSYIRRFALAGVASISDDFRVSDRVITFTTLAERCQRDGVTLDDRRQDRQRRHNDRRAANRAHERRLGNTFPKSKRQNASDSLTDAENRYYKKVGRLIQTLKAHPGDRPEPLPLGGGGVPHDAEDGGQGHGTNIASKSDAALFPVPSGKAVTKEQFKSINAANGLNLQWRFMRWLKAPPEVLIDAIFFAKQAHRSRQETSARFISLERVIYNSVMQRMRGVWGDWRERIENIPF